MAKNYKQDFAASQRQQLVSVPPFAGFFGSKSGGKVSADPSKVYDGGKKRPETLSATAETDNVTVSRPYRPLIHGPIMRALQRQVGEFRTTITIYDTDPDLGRLTEPQNVYADALLVGLDWPEHDASSSDGGMIELEFSVEAS